MISACDLHIHSHYSDGTASCQQILTEAETLGLSAVALTDHNTVAGLPEFLEAARGRIVQAIPGVEISTGYRGKELHILGLFLRQEDFGRVEDFVKVINFKKEQSNRELLDALNAKGIPLDYDGLLAQSPGGTVNRANIAAMLLKMGYVDSVEEAFRGILSVKNGCYRPPERIPAMEAIAFLSSLQAAVVLAHPYLNLCSQELRSFLPEAKAHGLTAMETVYSSYSTETAAEAFRIAEEFGLLQSGGSDYHGENKPEIRLGVGRGNLRVPGEFACRLRQAVRGCMG